MKAKMLKVDLLIREAERKDLTEALQDLGLLHIEKLEKDSSLQNHGLWKEWQELKNWLKALDTEANEFEGQKLEGDLIPQLRQFKKDWSLWKHRQEDWLKSKEFCAIWQDYDPKLWKQFESLGLKIQLYRCTKREWPQYQAQAFLIGAKDEEYYFCRIGAKENWEDLNLENLSLPPYKAEQLQTIEVELNQESHRLQSLLIGFKNAREDLESEAAAIQENWEFQQGMQSWQDVKATPLTHLRAWIPEKAEAEFRRNCSALPLAFRLQIPDRKDNVPVQLENNAFNRLFEPITQIFQLPHYYEFDLTPMIAVFYPILFAYCLGDAGYGAIMTLAVLIGWFTFLKKQRALAALVGILGISTTIMGFIKSGSLFGIALSANADQAWIRGLSDWVIIPDDSSFFFNAFNVALLIGVLQILIGIGIAIAKAWYFDGFKASLSLWGKLLIVMSSVALFMADTLHLSTGSIQLLIFSLVFGIALIMFFHDLSQALLVRMGSSILPLFFIFTGLLGDVLSYVRLFALGVTSAVLGLVVNRIGTDMMSDNLWTWIGAGAFLLFGHGLNFVLAALGSFIHPLRLTFVEFYNNAQFEGGGQAYRAFKKHKPFKNSHNGNS
ncbi:V-type ATP synthase subunit I [Croceimicrobium sp.]|uniref:V-type ATP synthase subunit I n=1 Tax=Croceimicrobium sp. TaxID=2828340 RepID=UPI003BA88A55